MNQPDFSIYLIFLFGFGVPLLVLPAAYYLRRHWSLQKRLAMAPFLFAVGTILYAALIGANYRKPGNGAFACIFGALWLTQGIMVIYVWRKMNREVRRAAVVGRSPPSHVDPFFWQGLLILLPVVMLSLVGLASLKQDEQAAEQEERKRAAQNVEILARAIRPSVSDDLERFLIAQNEWMIEMHSASQPVVKMQFPDEILKADLAKWERPYPDLKIADLASPKSDVLTNGRSILTSGHRLEPPDIPDVPVPPKWYRELTPAQQGLWQALRRAEADHAGPVELNSAREAFLNTGVTDDAREAANCVLRPYEDIAGIDNALSATESGLPFQDLACYRMLATNRPPASNLVLNAVWNRVIRLPSFAAPTLLDMAERLTNGADASVCLQVHWMREYWRAQERAREWLGPLRQLPGLKTNWALKVNWSSWTTEDAGGALAAFTICTYKDGGHDDCGYFIWFFPRPVIEAVFAKALADNRSLLPDYASATVTVQGSPLKLAGGPAATIRGPLLGNYQLPFGQNAAVNASTFELAFYLTNRELMLSAARARAARFGLLIAAAAATALFGYFMARRAFFRQLRLNEMKSDFVSSVSHELRAPIASVRLMAEGLERGRISEPGKQHEYFKFIVQECRRLSSLIENVLDFSRIEQGRKQYEMESTDLVALTEKTVTLMETYAAERQISLTLKKIGEPTPVEMDGKAMQQALVNLIDNAIKHSPKGGEITVGLEFKLQLVPRPGQPEGWTPTKSAQTSPVPMNQPCSHEHGHVLIWVEDRGEGIPAAEHEKIFERFYRVGSELRRETQGVGIGLSIVRHIVEAHGGRVIVRSAPGEGSRFTIELPTI